MITIPAWRPMPEFAYSVEYVHHAPSHEIDQAAALRAQHRRIMAVRWRCPSARTEDRLMGRLPEDWHDWMHCPAVDGYGSFGCTCDQWYSRVKQRGRVLVSHKLHTQQDLGSSYLVLSARLVETIDCAFRFPILSHHATPLGPLGCGSSLAHLPQVVGPITRSAGGRYTAWVQRKRGQVPPMRVPGSHSRRLDQGPSDRAIQDRWQGGDRDLDRGGCLLLELQGLPGGIAGLGC
jgi:hypothetical protein